MQRWELQRDDQCVASRPRGMHDAQICLVFVRQTVYIKPILNRMIGITVERRQRKAIRAFLNRVAASCAQVYALRK